MILGLRSARRRLLPREAWTHVRWALLVPVTTGVLLAGCDHSWANQSLQSPELNAALGRSYTLTPSPSYPHCTDPGDLEQLTDGHSSGSVWQRKSTVGWGYPKSLPRIVIDLGQVEPIREVRVHSIGGGNAGVFYPASILLAVSDDHRTFHVAGAADSLGLAEQRHTSGRAPKKPHVFRLGDLETRGRYVLVLLQPNGGLLFLDEIEVIRGDHDPAAVSFAPDNCFRLAEVTKLLPALRARAGLSALQQALRASARESGDLEATAWSPGLLRRLHAPRAVYDVDEIRRLADELYAWRGRELQRREGTRLSWSVVNPMQPVQPTSALPEPARRHTQLELRCWQGEYESAAVGLLNCGESRLRLGVSVSPWRHQNGATYPAQECVTLRQALPVESHSLGPLCDALVKLGEEGLVLPAGQMGQLWLTFHHPALPLGQWSFVVRITATDEADPAAELPAVVIPGRLTIDPISFPDRPALKTCNWSYIQRGAFTSEAPREALADLRAHYTNVFVLTWDELPLPKRGPDGRIRVDFNHHAQALRLYADAQEYLFFWGCSERSRGVRGPDRLSPDWKAVMKPWLKRWVAFLHQHGIGYDRFAMYPFDEHIGEEFYQLARFIKEVDPRIRIYANSRGDKRGEQMRRVAPYVDIWCLGDRPAGYRHPAAERRLRAEADTWTYTTRGPAAANPPYAYYRLQMWRAAARQDTGCGFWHYARRGKPSVASWGDSHEKGYWLDVVYGQRACPIDTAGESIIPSRRWECWREGVEDYEYLSRLKTAIESARNAGHQARAHRGQRVWDRAVREVITNPDDPDVVYDARRLIVAQIMELEQP